MNEAALRQLKDQIWNACIQKVQERMEEAGAAMDRAGEAVMAEEKSSAGDKYETGRAMGFLERERYASVFAQAQKELAFYRNRKPTSPAVQAEPGVLLVAEGLIILLATGIGKLEVAGHQVLVISIGSPLGQKIKGLKAGASFLMGDASKKIMHLT